MSISQYPYIKIPLIFLFFISASNGYNPSVQLQLIRAINCAGLTIPTLLYFTPLWSDNLLNWTEIFSRFGWMLLVVTSKYREGWEKFWASCDLIAVVNQAFDCRNSFNMISDCATTVIFSSHWFLWSDNHQQSGLHSWNLQMIQWRAHALITIVNS